MQRKEASEKASTCKASNTRGLRRRAQLVISLSNLFKGLNLLKPQNVYFQCDQIERFVSIWAIFGPKWVIFRDRYAFLWADIGQPSTRIPGMALSVDIFGAFWSISAKFGDFFWSHCLFPMSTRKLSRLKWPG